MVVDKLSEYEIMKVAIYNPYLDTLGGGERYTMAVATTLRDAGYSVEIQWKDQVIRKKLEERFDINLKFIDFVSDIKRGENFDVCFWVSDGSIPLLRARNNILHFQVPFHDVNGKSLLNRMKLFRIKSVVCNSNFTKRVIDNEYGVESLILYPPVDIEKFKRKRKENIILYVGRFSQLQQSKNQHILVENFKKLYQTGFENWKLILAGGVEIGAEDYVKELEKSIEGYPIEILKSPTFRSLTEIYGKSKIFWSAVGFGSNEKKEPEKAEQFGITLVEAMSAGVIPIVYRAGGYKEIITEDTGYFWSDENDLIKITTALCNAPFSTWKKITDCDKERSRDFSYKEFADSFLKLL